MKATVLWFCGLSGSGKTTIAVALRDVLLRKGKRVLILDGDVVRETLHRHLGFTPEEIRENNRLIIQLCVERRNENDFILVPIISPFRTSRDEAKELLGAHCFEIFVNPGLATCIKRDPKGLYAKAAKGELPNLIGISEQVPFEPPHAPDIELKTDRENVADCVGQLLEYLESREVI